MTTVAAVPRVTSFPMAGHSWELELLSPTQAGVKGVSWGGGAEAGAGRKGTDGRRKSI